MASTRRTNDGGGGSRRSLLTALAALAAAPAAGCSLVGAFNAVAGRDPGGALAESGIAFGPHPRHRLDIYRPSETSGRRPVVLFIYGGSWVNGRRQEYAFVGSALAALGYVTVIADYRLGPETVFPGFLDDGALALRWMQTEIAAHGGDGARIAVVGHSAGAYNAAMLALDRRRLRAAGVEPGGLRAFAGLAGPYDFFPWDSPTSRAAFGAWPNPEQTQPINFASASAPPALLATGDADETVRPSNTHALAARLRAAGASVEERVYPGIDHARILTSLARLDRTRAPVLADLASFLGRKLGGEG